MNQRLKEKHNNNVIPLTKENPNTASNNILLMT